MRIAHSLLPRLERRLAALRDDHDTLELTLLAVPYRCRLDTDAGRRCCADVCWRLDAAMVSLSGRARRLEAALAAASAAMARQEAA